MKVLECCMMGAAILLLVCEVTVGQLCDSLIILVDGFHTLFILIHMALTLQTVNTASPLSAESPPASSSSTAAPDPLRGTQASPHGSILGDPPPAPPAASPPALGCGLSYTKCRIQIVGSFLSALFLASLCLSAIMDIVGLFVGPKPVQFPLLLVIVSTSSLLFKMLVLWFNRGQQQFWETKSSLDLNQKVLAEGGAEAQAELGRVLCDVSRVGSAAVSSFHNGALVLCNPGTPALSDTEAPELQARVHWLADPDSRGSEISSSQYKDMTEIAKAKDSGDLGSQNASNTSPVYKSSHHMEGPVQSSRRPFLFVIQGFGAAIPALISNLAMLLNYPLCLENSGTCSVLVYLDPGLSLLAVIMLIASLMPQVCQYGLLLLQATPAHVCASDLGQLIESIPGVHSVHDLHIWQLTDSFMVASVHVHCHADFQTHRCADLMSGVTNVLQSVGVKCCTVQPEFTSCSESSTHDTFRVDHGVDVSQPHHDACSLACTAACAGSMCCSPSEEDSRILLTPPAEETKKTPDVLVMENNFLEKIE